jgi:hypothetical protein
MDKKEKISQHEKPICSQYPKVESNLFQHLPKWRNSVDS